MINLKKKIVITILAGIIVFCGSATVTTSAAPINADVVGVEPTCVARVAAFREYYLGCNDNVYSQQVWGSLAAAQAYYGRDFTYRACNVTYGGTNYNYCYAFSDGSYCFFRVAR